MSQIDIDLEQRSAKKAAIQEQINLTPKTQYQTPTTTKGQVWPVQFGLSTPFRLESPVSETMMSNLPDLSKIKKSTSENVWEEPHFLLPNMHESVTPMSTTE